MMFKQYKPEIVRFTLPMPSVYRTLFNLANEPKTVQVKVKRASPFNCDRRTFVNHHEE